MQPPPRETDDGTTTQNSERNTSKNPKVAMDEDEDEEVKRTGKTTTTTKKKESAPGAEKIERTTRTTKANVKASTQSIRTNHKTVSIADAPTDAIEKAGMLPRELTHVFADIWGIRGGREDRRDYDFVRLDANGERVRFPNCNRVGEYHKGKSQPNLRSYKAVLLFVSRNLNAYRNGKMTSKFSLIASKNKNNNKKKKKQTTRGERE
mmetsp:Transcript_432/g.1148  ORF Transcript_432/g.1148 Transcript_432/m.1148 type:complete len:207 (+) Transcript_432:176-796(+)